MATAIFFNGRRIVRPQAASRIDASALASLSPAAVGIVGLLGTAEGGKPLTVDSTYSDHTRPESVLDTYRSGDLRIAGQFCFEPSADESVPGGAQRLVAVKVNPATQSAVTLPDANAIDSVDLTSSDWGLFTAQINITVEAGTNVGTKITIIFESTTEMFDDVGGTSVFDVIFAPGADGYDTITGIVTSTQFTAAATKAETGLVAQVTDATPAGFPSVADIVSSSGADTTQSITLYGIDSSGDAAQETVALNGTTNVQSATVWTKVLGAALSSACAGTVTVSDFPVANTVMTIAPATLTRGVVQVTNGPVSGVLTVSVDTDNAHDVAMFGLSPAGAAIGEAFDMTSGATTPVVGAVTFGSLAIMALGETPGARTITVSCNAAQTSHSVYTTVQRVVDYLNNLDGFTANANVTNATTFLMTDMDYTAAVSLLTPAKDFYANLFFFVDKINQESALLDAARNAAGVEVPANTAAPVYLTGGGEGTTTITEWTAAFNLLKQRRVNITVALTRDPAVHALQLLHHIFRAGAGRSEANGYVGIGTAGGAGETKANIKSQIQTLQSRHLSFVSQEMKRFDPDTGVETWYPPHYLAAILAGMQAGSVIGEPLTRKRPFVTDIRQDSTWNPLDDGDELIDAGLLIVEKVDGEGIRVVRSITGHLADDNVVFGEMSANESANTAVYELRRRLDKKIGQRGLSDSVNVIKGLASGILGELIDDEIIVAWRALAVEQVGDVFPVSVEVAPVLPINFIPITVHLVALRAAA